VSIVCVASWLLRATVVFAWQMHNIGAPRTAISPGVCVCHRVIVCMCACASECVIVGVCRCVFVWVCNLCVLLVHLCVCKGVCLRVCVRV